MTDWVSLPKVELHLHVAGSARPSTLAELEGEAARPLLRDYGPAQHGEGLARYLMRFRAYDAAVRTPSALGRVVTELCEDLRADGVRYAELRLRVPDRAASDREWDAYMGATVEAMNAAHAGGGPRCQAIVVLLRHWPLERVEREIGRAIRWSTRGIAGVDVAGDEAVDTLETFAPALWRARDAGLELTVHTGEARGPEAVARAVRAIAPRRIAHGVRAGEDPAVEASVREAGVHLEVALTSNLQTSAVGSLADHPFGRWAHGGGPSVGLSTDNRAISGVTLSGELRLAAEAFGLGRAELGRVMCSAAEAAFLPPDERAALVGEIEDGWRCR